MNIAQLATFRKKSLLLLLLVFILSDIKNTIYQRLHLFLLDLIIRFL